MTAYPIFIPSQEPVFGSDKPLKPHRIRRNVRGKLENIKLLALDVDGVLTDGRTFCDDRGAEGMFFSVQDGSAIKWLHRAGLQTAIISGRDTAALQHRVSVLAIPYVFKGVKIKMEAYEELKRQSGLGDESIAYAGDDLHDLPVMRHVVFSCAVKNARYEVRKQADYVTCAPGGCGAVREIAELLLKIQNKWDDITRRYFID